MGIFCCFFIVYTFFYIIQLIDLLLTPRNPINFIVMPGINQFFQYFFVESMLVCRHIELLYVLPTYCIYNIMIFLPLYGCNFFKTINCFFDFFVLCLSVSFLFLGHFEKVKGKLKIKGKIGFIKKFLIEIE